MRIAPIPVNDELRLQDLQSYGILDSESEPEFEELLEVAAQIYGCPISAISFIDRDRQWFKACRGIEVQEMPREISFCAHAIMQEEVLQVHDTHLDERFHDNPLVQQDPNLRFYAGAPLISGQGYRLGTFCIADREPRTLTPEEARTLSILSGQVSRLLELRLKNRVLKERADEVLSLEREILHRTLRQQEAERLQLSTELHEEIAQRLAATKFYLELAEGSDNMAALISKSRELIEGLTRQVQELSRSLTPSTMEHTNLRDLLQHLLTEFTNRHPLPARLQYVGAEETDPELALVLYRVAEEGLKNILTHAGATEVVISVQVTGSLHLRIEDNGRGVLLPALKRGSGLQGMLSRLTPFGGEIHMSSRPGGGCTLSVTVPDLVAQDEGAVKEKSAG